MTIENSEWGQQGQWGGSETFWGGVPRQLRRVPKPLTRGIPRTIDMPFRFDEEGKVAATADPTRMATARMAALIDTMPGERVMRPRFGTAARETVFRSADSASRSILASSINEAVAVYEPGIILTHVDPLPVEGVDDGMLEVEIGFSLRDPVFQGQVVEASIGVGGGVEDR